ncbi:MAG: hypothetical protein AB4062_15135 [Crocosphaera sp.]
MKTQRPFAIFISPRGIEFTSTSQLTFVEDVNLVCYVDSQQAGLRIAENLAIHREKQLFYQF